jgi:hypothetical protein
LGIEHSVNKVGREKRLGIKLGMVGPNAGNAVSQLRCGAATGDNGLPIVYFDESQ